VSVRGIWSDEANAEAEEIMNKKVSVLNINGTNGKFVIVDTFDSSYELTKIDENIKANDLSKEDIERVLNLEPDDITLSLFTEFFAATVDITNGRNNNRRESKYKPWSKFTVPANYFYENQPKIESTIGRFLFNKFVLQSSGIIPIRKYINDTIGSKIRELDDLVARYLMDDSITKAQFDSYIDHRDNLAFWLIGVLSHTISPKMAKPLPNIENKKKELWKKYGKKIEEHDLDAMVAMVNELIAYAKEELKDDPGMNQYLSGNLNFGNNYRNNALLRGPVMNKIDNRFDFVSASFMDGTEIKDIPSQFASILAGQYPMSIATKESGYIGKQLIALLQMMEVDEHGSDCGTKITIPTIVSKTNKKDLVYSYIKENGQLKLLTPENIDSYLGKTVQMRSPMTCINENLCNICAGEIFNKLNIKLAGLYATQLSYSALNLGMKAKHNSAVELITIDVDTVIDEI